MDAEVNPRRWPTMAVGTVGKGDWPRDARNFGHGARPRRRTALVLAVALGLAAVTPAAEDTWTRRANMPTARTAVSTSAVEGKIYAIGGRRTTSGSAIATVEEYDPRTDTWTRKADIPTPRMCCTCAVNGKIYAIGGVQDATFDPLATVEEYDPATDTWTRKADMPTARRCPVSAVNGRIYAIGGRGEQLGGTGDNGEDLAIVEVYDPTSDTWTRTADLPTVRSGPSTCVVNGKIYAIGGYTGIVEQGARIYSTVEEYDPATDSWTAKSSMQTPRAAFDICAVGGKIYAFAGTPFTTYYSSVEEYDIASDTWIYKANIPTARSNFGVSAVDGKIYVIGGRTWGNVVISTVEEYDTGFAVLPPDFNGDGVADIEDLLRLIESWGRDDPLVDIAPPFGDGIIDVLDLEALMEFWGQEVDDPTLIVHWGLDETEGITASDSVGRCNGTVCGDPFWLPDGGVAGGALALDGSGDFIAADFVLDPADGPFGVLAWIKTDVPGRVIVSQQQGADWLASAPTGALVTGLQGSRRGAGPLTSEAVITDGLWHRVALVWDGVGRSLYVDGSLVAEDEQGSLTGCSGGLNLGCDREMTPGTFFCGSIDDLRIYSRVVKPWSTDSVRQIH